MIDYTHTSFAANDRSYFALLKKDIQRIAAEAGLKASRLSELELIVSEMTSNLSKYAKDGELLLGVFGEGNDAYVELIGIDNGPGMAHPQKMIQDGMTTGSSLGHGLGSMKRLSDVFDLYSITGWGTILLCRIYIAADKLPKNAAVQIRPLVVYKPGEDTSGDGFVMKKTKGGFQFLLADGLGHGEAANEAVNMAATHFLAEAASSPAEVLRGLHPAIKKSRGAVAHVLNYETAQKRWTCCGIGNIAIRFFGAQQHKNHMSYNGIVGHNIPNTLNDQSYSAQDYPLAILCSDGIKTRWDLSKYPQILQHDPAILAAALYKEHGRKTDDMSVVIIKVK